MSKKQGSNFDDGIQLEKVEISIEKSETNLYDVRDYPTGTAYDFDAGLTNNVCNQTETPKQFLERILLDDEEILDTFDVKFPGDFLPLWYIVQCLFMSCGLFGLYLLYREIRRCCYRNRCCTPPLVSFEFGKMAVTNKGRAICWNEEIKQTKHKGYQGCCLLLYLDWCLVQILWCIFAKCCVMCCCSDLCRPATSYVYWHSTRSYRISNIQQITQFMTSQANCIWCCLDYRSGVEISFNEFNHVNPNGHLEISSRSCFSGISWLCTDEDKVSKNDHSAVSSSTRLSYYGWARSFYGAANNVVGAIMRSAGNYNH